MNPHANAANGGLPDELVRAVATAAINRTLDLLAQNGHPVDEKSVGSIERVVNDVVSELAARERRSR